MIRMLPAGENFNASDIVGKIAIMAKTAQSAHSFAWTDLERARYVASASSSLLISVCQTNRIWDDGRKMWLLQEGLFGSDDVREYDTMATKWVRCVCDTVEEANQVLMTARDLREEMKAFAEAQEDKIFALQTK